MTIGIVAAMLGAGTFAYFSDTETSNGNTFTATSLDLKIDDGDTNVVKFTVTDMRPGKQPKATWKLTNVGALDGYLDLENIVVTSYENDLVDPEIDAGDITGGDPGQGNGELQDVVNLRLFIDYDHNGWISTGDNVFYDGLVKDLPTNFELDEPINAGADLYIVAIFDWWSTPDDNLAQTDGFDLDIEFELGQTTGQ
ncbi:MAG: hypothetical protein J7K83_02190 [Candidatus Aenigmarchaeota archaeon]|nr:hypothetical protein [Candidatus Aenigmarchaeota archaeon]